MVFILWKWPNSRENTANLKMSHFFVNSLIIYDHCKVYTNTWFTMEFAISHHSNQFYSILNWWFLSGECSYSIHISESMTCSFAMLEWATGIVGTSRFTEIRIIIFIVIWFRMCSQFFFLCSSAKQFYYIWHRWRAAEVANMLEKGNVLWSNRSKLDH